MGLLGAILILYVSRQLHQGSGGTEVGVSILESKDRELARVGGRSPREEDMKGRKWHKPGS